MGEGGDSGSLIGIDDGGFRATDLLFAGSPEATIGVPIAALEAEHGELSLVGESEADEDGSGGFGRRLRDRLERHHGDVREENGAFRVDAWPLDLLVVPGEDPDWAAKRARGSDADAVAIAVPVDTDGRLPAIPAGVAVVRVDP